MSKRSTSALIAILAVTLLPSLALADAALVQGPCERIPGSDALRVTFTLVNFSLTVPVCDLHLIPEPQPPLAGCLVRGCEAPADWACQLDASGGASWVATAATACVGTGGTLSGFSMILDNPVLCCYHVQFTGPQGEVIVEQEECFSCVGVPDDQTTWGMIKSRY
jgi:hypothetical protein